MKKQQRFTSKTYLNKQILFWRKVLGIDPIYTVCLNIVPQSEAVDHIDLDGDADEAEVSAWIGGLDSTHPIVSIYLTKEFLSRNRYDELAINETVLHELLHMVVSTSFSAFTSKPSIIANEKLVIKLTTAIMQIVKKGFKSKKKRRKNHSNNA